MRGRDRSCEGVSDRPFGFPAQGAGSGHRLSGAGSRAAGRSSACPFLSNARKPGADIQSVGKLPAHHPLAPPFRPTSRILLRFTWYQRLHAWLHMRTMHRSDVVERYGALGLILFTAIPFPTTGAYTACLAASFFDIRFRYALIAISAGVLISGIAITATLYSFF